MAEPQDDQPTEDTPDEEPTEEPEEAEKDSPAIRHARRERVRTPPAKEAEAEVVFTPSARMKAMVEEPGPNEPGGSGGLPHLPEAEVVVTQMSEAERHRVIGIDPDPTPRDPEPYLEAQGIYIFDQDPNGTMHMSLGYLAYGENDFRGVRHPEVLRALMAAEEAGLLRKK